MSTRFARWVFLLSGIYGLLILPPQYLMEQQIGEDYPPPIAHPEYFYGFVGVAVAWQVAFLVIARDPVRYRLLMLPAVLEKFSFALAAWGLFASRLIPGVIVAFASVDFVLGILFLVAFWRTPAS